MCVKGFRANGGREGLLVRSLIVFIGIAGGGAMAGVNLERVSRIYAGPVAALQDVSLEVRDGEFLVLVGPSGSGKTTLLRLIAGLDRASEGEIRIGGVSVGRVPARQRDVAMVFQSYALYPHRTVARNLAMALELRWRKGGWAHRLDRWLWPARARQWREELDRRVQDAARILGIEEFLPRFSTGDLPELLKAQSYLSTFLPTHNLQTLSPPEWLPTIFKVWSMVMRSNDFDRNFLSLVARTAEDNVGTYPLFSQSQIRAIFSAGMRTMDLPVGSNAHSAGTVDVEIGILHRAVARQDVRAVIPRPVNSV